MRKGKFKFTSKNGVEEQVALETLLDQIVDSPIRALMPNTNYKTGEIALSKEDPRFFAVCVSEGRTDENIRALLNADNYGVPTQCGTARFIVHVTSYIPTRKDLTAYAKLESPHLTGIPTAPTASSGTNTTQIATTEFVKTALATFNLAEYLKVADAQRTYAPLNSPFFSGNPKAPNPNYSSNDNSLATTNFVRQLTQNAGGGIVAANLNQNGYVKFANGLILQWGIANSNRLAVVHVSFPISFRSSVFNAICSSIGASTGYTKNTGMVADLSLGGMRVTVDNSGGYWFAIGR